MRTWILVAATVLSGCGTIADQCPRIDDTRCGAWESAGGGGAGTEINSCWYFPDGHPGSDKPHTWQGPTGFCPAPMVCVDTKTDGGTMARCLPDGGH